MTHDSTIVEMQSVEKRVVVVNLLVRVLVLVRGKVLERYIDTGRER